MASAIEYEEKAETELARREASVEQDGLRIIG
jgi:hypothetical protein